MRHITRKPVLPAMLLALLVFGVVFLSLFQKSIHDDAAQVEALYRNTQITFRIVPGEKLVGDYALPLQKGTRITALEGVTQTSGLMHCLYTMEAGGETIQSRIFGTQDLRFLSQENTLVLTFFDGYDEQSFRDFDPWNAPCLVEKEMYERLGLRPGDILSIRPVDYRGTVLEDAPTLQFFVAGTYRDPLRKLSADGLIVPEEMFLTDITIPQLLYNSHMLMDCFYRQYAFRIDSSYNRDYSAIVEEVEDMLPGDQEYALASDAKALTLAVRPLERKLAIQRLLLPALSVLLCIAAAICALLLGISWKREIFLRLMWGEERRAVLKNLMLGLLLLLAAGSLLALGLTLALGGAAFAPGCIALMDGLCLGAGFLPLRHFCNENLITLYQAGEG